MLKALLELGVTNTHFNSREIRENGLFIPLTSENNDGHKFIENAISNGAIATLWNKNIDIPFNLEDKISFFLVDDTLEAFQDLAAEYRNIVNPTVIAITGSNGKTTTKELLYSVLSTNFKVHKNQGNFNNHLGVPLTLLQMPLDTDICILEMGMNHIGEISVLSNLAAPDIAFITNIGESHIGLLGSRKNIAKAKQEILEGLKNKKSVYYDGDEQLLEHLDGIRINKREIKDFIQHKQAITFAFDNRNFKIPTYGFHNAKNALFAIKLARNLGLSDSKINIGLQQFNNQSMRLEYVEHSSLSFLIDCYNSSLSSIISGLETFLSINIDKNKIAVLGDIFELGEESTSTHREIGNLISSYPQLQFYLVGKEMRQAFENTLSKDTLYFESVEKLSWYLVENIEPNSFLYLKASRGMKLERLYNGLIGND